jgi:YD repeat-containing protein
VVRVEHVAPVVDLGGRINAGDDIRAAVRTFGLKQTLAILFAGLSNQAADYVTDYERDFYGRVTQIDQSGTAAAGQLAIARKVVDLEYNRLGSFDSITRSVGAAGSETVVADSDYSYFETGYLQSITHEDLGGTEIGGYSWDYELAGQVTSFTAPEGTTAYAYDNTGQLIGGVLTAAGVTTATEDFDYDDTGNRLSQTSDGVTTSNLVSRNRLLSDGKYNYTYDDNGNRTQKLEIASGDYQDFTWDHRNRLTLIEFRDSAGTLQQAVRFSYDAFDQRILSELDGDGTFEQFDRAVWDRSEVALVLDVEGAVQHRFLHGPGVDQVFGPDGECPCMSGRQRRAKLSQILRPCRFHRPNRFTHARRTPLLSSM